MNEYIVITDVGGDLPAEVAEKNGIEVIRMAFSFSEEETYWHYPDFRNYGAKEFYDRLRAGESASTSQVSVGDYVEAFTPILEQGKDILCLCLSSAISGTYNSCSLAVDHLREQYKENKIIFIDGKGASMGSGLMAYHLALNKAKGMSIEENAAWMEENVLHLAHWFTVDDLNHLRRGGRCSALSAFMGTLMNIKPVLHVDNEGFLKPVEKVRTANKALDRMAQMAEETGLDMATQPIFISHSDNLAGAERVANRLRENCGATDITIGAIGPVVGAHCGPGTVALFFLAEKR